jgi:hypothetical protein
MSVTVLPPGAPVLRCGSGQPPQVRPLDGKCSERWRIPGIVSGDWGKKMLQKESHKRTARKSTRSQSFGPLVDEWLPEHDTFNGMHFCEVVIQRLTSAVFSNQATWCRQAVCLHVYNARPRNSTRSVQCINNRKNKRMSYPSYSPNIAPSDFCLFGTVEQPLQTCQGRSFEELRENTREIMGSIGPTGLAGTVRA